MRHSFWVRTQELIKTLKISQQKLAQLAGINYNTFRCWKYNDRIPDAVSACDISDALGVSVEYLVRGKDGKSSRRKITKEKERRIVSDRIKKLAIKLGEETIKL